MLTFISLFVVGVTIVDLTHRVQQREAQTAELYAISHDFGATIDEETILRAVLKHVEAYLAVNQLLGFKPTELKSILNFQHADYNVMRELP